MVTTSQKKHQFSSATIHKQRAWTSYDTRPSGEFQQCLPTGFGYLYKLAKENHLSHTLFGAEYIKAPAAQRNPPLHLQSESNRITTVNDKNVSHQTSPPNQQSTALRSWV
jgi:hypothetical protein